MKTPRAGTRVRAVYDVLQDGKEHHWKDLASTYAYAYAPYANLTYVSLTLGRILRKYATRVRRGVYVKKENQVIPNPFAHVAKQNDVCPFKVGDIVECVDIGSTGNHIVKGETYTILSVRPEKYAKGGWIVEVDTRTHGRVGIYPTRFKLYEEPKVEVLRHGGPEPKMTDVCATCGQKYGNHYGYMWPEPTDCPVMKEHGPTREEDLSKRRYWTATPKPPLGWEIKGSPEIEDMAWSRKTEATTEKNEEPYPFGRKFKSGDVIRYNGGYGHFKTVPIGSLHVVDCYKTNDGSLDKKGFIWLVDAPPGAAKGGHGEEYFSLAYSDLSVLEARIEDLERELKEQHKRFNLIVGNKNTYISKIETKLTEVAERSHRRQQLIDETADEKLKLENRLENGKTAIDTARSMLADILVGAINEAPRAIEELDAQLSGTYGVLDGTMDE
jgi:hypothetical protein